MKKKNIAIVTGASSGLGKEFVKLLSAKKGLDEIWIISRNEEKLKKYDNNIYILDTDGNVKDTVTLNGTDDTAGGNIPGEFYGGDDRCLLIVFSKYDIKGLELSEEKTALRAELIEEARKNKKGSPVVSISAILDKSQIGSGAITLEQITPE